MVAENCVGQNIRFSQENDVKMLLHSWRIHCSGKVQLDPLVAYRKLLHTKFLSRSVNTQNFAVFMTMVIYALLLHRHSAGTMSICLPNDSLQNATVFRHCCDNVDLDIWESVYEVRDAVVWSLTKFYY